MTTRPIFLFMTCALAASASPALAQLSIPWLTIDGGGGTSIGGTFSLSGTIGQPDAGSMSGGQFALTGGFWVRGSLPCRADFNNDGTADFFDYLDFVAAFDGEAPNADFNGDSTVDFFDYLDFVASFDVGCD